MTHYDYFMVQKMVQETAVKSYTDDKISFTSVPKHVAIIMDGNRRWAKTHNRPFYEGHKRGAEILTSVVHAAEEFGIEVLTVFAFSTENWKRSEKEVAFLMQTLENYLREKKEELIQSGVKLETVGDTSLLPDSVKIALKTAQEETKHCSQIRLILALNYGGRDEIRRACVEIAKKVKEGIFTEKDITEDLIGKYLDTHAIPDPALVIRTSGEMRLSNFLIWQSSYAEIYVTKTTWPDFTKEEFIKALISYQERNQRFGV